MRFKRSCVGWGVFIIVYWKILLSWLEPPPRPTAPQQTPPLPQQTPPLSQQTPPLSQPIPSLHKRNASNGWNGHDFAVSFSWDDGNDAQVTYVPSQMTALGIRGTFYISPTFLNPVTDQPTPDQLEQKWQWAKKMYGPHEIGSHTLNHLNMAATLSDPEIRTQFEETNKIIARELNYTPTTLAWPFGKFNSRTRQLADKYYIATRGTRCAMNSIAPKKRLLYACELSSNLQANMHTVLEAKKKKAWLIFFGHGVDSCAPVNSDWVDVQIPVHLSKFKNSGPAKSHGRVSAIKNTRTGIVTECRYGWHPLPANVVRKTMEEVLKLDPYINSVSTIFNYRENIVG